jgi:hypothetical protein
MILVRNAFSSFLRARSGDRIRGPRFVYQDGPCATDLVRRVLDTVKREGVLAAYRKVQAKLSEPQAGYSSGNGDRGRTGNIGSLPRRRSRRVLRTERGQPRRGDLRPDEPRGLEFPTSYRSRMLRSRRSAPSRCGVRLAEPQLGGGTAVIGCGILGLFATQLLRAHGGASRRSIWMNGLSAVLGVGAETGVSRRDRRSGPRGSCPWTDGLGVDAVMSRPPRPATRRWSPPPAMCRDRAKVVAVGLVRSDSRARSRT